MTATLEVHFFGHAAVGLIGTDAQGHRRAVLLDPYEPGGFGGLMGYGPILFTPDVILHSHGHADHAHVAPFPGCPVLGPLAFARLGTDDATAAAWADQLALSALCVDHDAWDGSTRGGQTWMVALTLSGVRVVHSGDVGELPPQERLDSLAADGVDLFFAACGGFYTLGGAEASELARRLGARVTIPMHTRTLRCQLSELADDASLRARYARVGHAHSPCLLDRAWLDTAPQALVIATQPDTPAP